MKKIIILLVSSLLFLIIGQNVKAQSYVFYDLKAFDLFIANYQNITLNENNANNLGGKKLAFDEKRWYPEGAGNRHFICYQYGDYVWFFRAKDYEDALKKQKQLIELALKEELPRARYESNITWFPKTVFGDNTYLRLDSITYITEVAGNGVNIGNQLLGHQGIIDNSPPKPIEGTDIQNMENLKGELVGKILGDDPENLRLFGELQRKYGSRFEGIAQKYGVKPENINPLEAMRDLEGSINGQGGARYSSFSNGTVNNSSKGNGNTSPSTPNGVISNPNNGNGSTTGGTQQGTTGTSEGNQGNPNQVGSDEGKPGGTSESGTAKGLFKTKNAFSQWFSTAVDLIVKYFGLSAVKEAVEKALLLAYIIAPDLFESVGSFLAKLQTSLLSEDLNTFLDKMAEIANLISFALDCWKELDNLMEEPSFKELLKRVDMDKVLKELEKVPPLTENIEKLKEKFPFITEFNGEALLDAKKFAKLNAKVASSYADKGMKKLKIPITFTGLTECIDTKDPKKCVKSWAKTQGTQLATQKIPALKGQTEAINSLMNGDYKGAAKSGLVTQAAKSLGIDTQYGTNFIEALEKGDMAKALLEMSKAAAGRLGAGSCADLIESGSELFKSDTTLQKNPSFIKMSKELVDCGLRASKDSNLIRMADNVKKYGNILPLENLESKAWRDSMYNVLKNIPHASPEQINEWLNDKAEIYMKKVGIHLLQQQGFDAPNAAEAIMDGDWEKALNIQYKYTKEMGKLPQPTHSIKDRASLKTGFNKALWDSIPKEDQEKIKAYKATYEELLQKHIRK